MRAVSWLNTGMVAAGALLVAALPLAPRWLGPKDAFWAHQVVAGAVLVLGGLAFATDRAHARGLRRLTSHVEALSDLTAAPPAFTVPRRGATRRLAGAIDASVSKLRHRVDALVSQRRELDVQARIAEAERRHAEAVLNSISDAVVVTDAFDDVALANEAAARVLGFDLAGAVRSPVDRVVRDPLLVKLIKDAREGAAPNLRRHVEHRLGRGNPSTIYDVTLAGVAGGTGGTGGPGTRDGAAHAHAAEAGGVVTILRDITREKEIAEMKSDFVSKVSHELRTPLSSIKAYVEMLVDGEAHDEATRREFYDIIQGETDRLQRLIDNILNISRLESGVVKVQREPVALARLLKDAIDVMQPQARAKGVELSEVSSPVFFQVAADKDMIHQAILNLISNAIKYTDPGGRVTVAVGVDEHAGTVNVSVSDTGVGIPAAALPHLFEKFYRVAEHKKMAKGTGLGLNLVKHIIETVHGGTVSVASEPGKGSTFTFGLPMADRGC